MWWRGVGFDAATSWIAVAGYTAMRKQSLIAERISGALERLRHLFVTCIGTAVAYNGPLRLEDESANDTQALLESLGISPQHCHNVCVAIAVHPSPEIAENISVLAR